MARYEEGETGHRNLVVEPRKWLITYRTRLRQPRKTVRIARACPYIAQVVVETARDQMETMKGTPLIKIGTAAQNRGVMDFLSEGEGTEEDGPRIRTRKMMMGHLGVSEGDEGPGVTQDPRDQKDLGNPQGRWDLGEFLGHCLPLAWETQYCNPLM